MSAGSGDTGGPALRLCARGSQIGVFGRYKNPTCVIFARQLHLTTN
jgi:hypothetical protein